MSVGEEVLRRKKPGFFEKPGFWRTGDSARQTRAFGEHRMTSRQASALGSRIRAIGERTSRPAGQDTHVRRCLLGMVLLAAFAGCSGSSPPAASPGAPLAAARSRREETENRPDHEIAGQRVLLDDGRRRQEAPSGARRSVRAWSSTASRMNAIWPGRSAWSKR